jgi:hypothetical protein
MARPATTAGPAGRVSSILGFDLDDNVAVIVAAPQHIERGPPSWTKTGMLVVSGI